MRSHPPHVTRANLENYLDAGADPAARAEFLVDLHYCLDVGRFNFAMVVQRCEGLLIMEPGYPG